MFVESNPSPVKYAAKLLGLCDDAARLPLVKVTELHELGNLKKISIFIYGPYNLYL